MSFSDIFDMIKLAYKILKDQRFLLSVVLLSGILLFSPTSFLLKLGMADLVKNIRPWLGLAFLLSVAVLFSMFLFWIKDIVIKKISERRELKYAKENLRLLSDDEKRFLSDYIIERTITKNAHLDNGVANSLEHKGIIYRGSTSGRVLTGFPFILQPWAADELKKNPEFLEPELSLGKKR